MLNNNGLLSRLLRKLLLLYYCGLKRLVIFIIHRYVDNIARNWLLLGYLLYFYLGPQTLWLNVILVLISNNQTTQILEVEGLIQSWSTSLYTNVVLFINFLLINFDLFLRQWTLFDAHGMRGFCHWGIKLRKGRNFNFFSCNEFINPKILPLLLIILLLINTV